MTAESERSAIDDGSGQLRRTETDGGAAPTFDDEALYSVVRTAVKDAMLDVIGTVLLVGVGFVLVAAGGGVALGASSLPRLTVGVWLAVFGIYLSATAAGLLPPVRDWL